MSVESYHHHQPQQKQLSPFNVDQPHPAQFVPQNGNDVKNIHREGNDVKYVERDINDLNYSNGKFKYTSRPLYLSYLAN